MSFDSLGLRAELLRAVSAQGYTIPTPIQSQVIPVVLEGRDVMAGAQTGTGKTAGFTLPLLQRLAARAPEHGRRRSIRSLILAPTRELAAQVEESVRTYGKFLSLRSTAIFGGVGMHPQIMRLRDGVDIVVATPGRLLDHVSQRTIDLSRVEIFVLDEADRMLDMGFIHDIKKVIALLPRQRQNLMFSATTSNEIQDLASGLMNEAAIIHANKTNQSAHLVEHVIHPVDRNRKRELLTHIITEGAWDQVLVFTRTKHGADRLARDLERDGINAEAIHGNKSQTARTQALAGFKKGKTRVLVATDIAARGLDIDQLPHVVNYELPNVPEDYVHRIGRTGRAGNTGQAVSLVCIDERGFLRSIEGLIGRELPRVYVPGFEPDPSIRAEPIILGRRSQGRSSVGRSSAPRGGQPRRGAHSPASHRRSDRAESSRSERPRSGQPRSSERSAQGPREARPEGRRREFERAGAPRRESGYQDWNGAEREGRSERRSGGPAKNARPSDGSGRRGRRGDSFRRSN